MVKEKKNKLEELDQELEKIIEEMGEDVDVGEGVDVKDKTVEEVKDEKKGEIAENAESAAEAVEDGFGNINQMIYERLDINRACLMILFSSY